MASWRNERGLARLFDFEEFEEDFDFLSGHAPTLRVAADLIDFPTGGNAARPPVFGMPACLCWQGTFGAALGPT